MDVTIEKVGRGQAVAYVDGRPFEARFDGELRRWRVATDAGEQLSVSAKLHSIGKLFDVPRAFVAGAAPKADPMPTVVVEGETARQVRRMLASMREFTFDRGGAWRVMVGQQGFEEGYTYRQAGDPIFHTLEQAAGVSATRAQVEEALEAVADGRRPNLPPRMATLPDAIVLVAEALAAGRRRAPSVYGGEVRIEGPWLPPDFDAPGVED